MTTNATTYKDIGENIKNRDGKKETQEQNQENENISIPFSQFRVMVVITTIG